MSDVWKLEAYFEHIMLLLCRNRTRVASPPAPRTRPASHRTTSSPDTAWQSRSASGFCWRNSRDPCCDRNH